MTDLHIPTSVTDPQEAINMMLLWKIEIGENLTELFEVRNWIAAIRFAGRSADDYNRGRARMLEIINAKIDRLSQLTGHDANMKFDYYQMGSNLQYRDGDFEIEGVVVNRSGMMYTFSTYIGTMLVPHWKLHVPTVPADES